MASACVHLVLFLCFNFLPINGQIYLSDAIVTNDHLTLAKTAANLIRTHFSKHSLNVLVSENSFYPELRDYNEDIFEYITKNLDETITIQLYFSEIEENTFEYHVFIVDSEQAFINILRNYPKTNFDGDSRFLIVLTNYTSEYLETIENIFKACELNRVVNANILLHNKFLGVCLYNFNIFSKTKCNVVQPYLFYRFSDGLDKLNEMFPNKFLNFHGCPLRICGQIYYPMLTFSGNESNPKSENNWSNLRGIEGHFIKVLSQSLNFKIDLLPFPQEPTYFDEKTGYGCFEKLLKDKADIALGGLSASVPQRFGLTLAQFYDDSPIVFIVRAKHELEGSNRLGRPFSLPVWLSVVGLLITGYLIILVLLMLKPSARQFVFGKQNNTPLLNFFAIFLGYSVEKVPVRNFARYLLILWLLMTMILRNAYQGSLYDSIRIDRYEKVPKKYNELFKRNYTFLISKFYSDIDLFLHSQNIIAGLHYSERLKKLEKLNGNYATITLRDHVLIYLEKNIRYGCDLKIIDDAVYLHRSAIYFQRHSNYLTTFDSKLRKLIYFGIVKHIAGSNSKVSRQFKENNMPTPMKMTNDRIWSLYQICIVMLGCTCVVFVLELLSAYFEKLRSILNSMH